MGKNHLFLYLKDTKITCVSKVHRLKYLRVSYGEGKHRLMTVHEYRQEGITIIPKEVEHSTLPINDICNIAHLCSNLFSWWVYGAILSMKLKDQRHCKTNNIDEAVMTVWERLS